jgi:hypothetical protein
MWVPPIHPNHRPFKYWNCCFLRGFRGTFSFWEPPYDTPQERQIQGWPRSSILSQDCRSCDRRISCYWASDAIEFWKWWLKIPKTMKFDGLQSGFVNECEWIYLVSVQFDFTLMLDMAQRVQGSARNAGTGCWFPRFLFIVEYIKSR